MLKLVVDISIITNIEFTIITLISLFHMYVIYRQHNKYSSNNIPVVLL